MIRTNYTAEANQFYGGDIPGYIKKIGKGYIIMIVGDIITDEPKEHKVTVADVVYHYAFDARNLSSGCRSLGSIQGDWRPVSNMAAECLEWFKRVNRAALVKEGKKYGMTLK